MSRRRSNKSRVERYELARSPLAQKPTQKELAALLGLKKGQLRGVISHKEMYTVRRIQVSGNKTRHLIFPRGKLRELHERLKFHLNKIKQPPYVQSPRVGRAQRDNALIHAGQRQFFLFDIKQFYPSTSSEHVFRWARYELGMSDDVAGLLCALVTTDNQLFFGSPATPVLATLLHRRMFDEIYMECTRRGLKMSIWVDDVVISGKYITGNFISSVRDIVRRYGLKSHKLQMKSGDRAVLITGIPLRGGVVSPPMNLHWRIRSGYRALAEADTEDELEAAAGRLLSALGTLRYTVGRASDLGRRTAGRMAGLRQRRTKLLRNDRVGDARPSCPSSDDPPF